MLFGTLVVCHGKSGEKFGQGDVLSDGESKK